MFLLYFNFIIIQCVFNLSVSFFKSKRSEVSSFCLLSSPDLILKYGVTYYNAK